jgi:ABC-2 type transport system permease protein
LEEKKLRRGFFTSLAGGQTMSISFRCFLALVHKELSLFFKEFFSKLIDVSVILCTWVLVFGYLMTKSGLQTSYGTFILVGALASFGLFETVSRATLLAQDAADKKLSNLLILPLRSSLVFVAIGLSWAISTALLAICLLPLGKLLLWNQFDLSKISLWKFILIFSVGNLFYGFFALWVASLVTNLRNTEWLWTRIINPLYMFCGFFYSWQMVWETSHLIGYLHFLNPLLFIVEGTKAAVLGQGEFLSFWLCFFILWGFIAFFTYDALRRFKKRLDYV